MSGPVFVPLCCPGCGADLTGRGADCVAFCAPCGLGLRSDGQALAPVDVRTVAVDEPFAAGALPLPFWLVGRSAHPAFLSSRPLALARAASGLVSGWRTLSGLVGAPPLGGCIPPDGLAEASRLARLDHPEAAAVLLSVPCRPLDGGRWLLPGGGQPLYPDDVLEARALIAEATARAAEPDRSRTAPATVR